MVGGKYQKSYTTKHFKVLIFQVCIITCICSFLFSFQWLNPVEFLEDLVIEYEYIECTSSSIQALILFRKLYPGHRRKEINNFITRAADYIEDIQYPDGSWYGNWGICFVYGTWFAIKGLEAAGRTYDNCEAVRKGVNFLLKSQREDGGWGEHYTSCTNKVHYSSSTSIYN